eukprot:8180367-Heterocapsa_arctica.AAC.1
MLVLQSGKFSPGSSLPDQGLWVTESSVIKLHGPLFKSSFLTAIQTLPIFRDQRDNGIHPLKPSRLSRPCSRYQQVPVCVFAKGL